MIQDKEVVFLKAIRERYITRALNLPDFVDTADSQHFNAYAYLREVYNNIIVLISKHVFDDVKIMDLAEETSDMIEEILILMRDSDQIDKYLLYCSEIISLIEDLIADLSDLELYEAAANVNKLYKLIKR